MWFLPWALGCRPPDETDAPVEAARPVTCDTDVVPTAPCLVAADGSGTYTTIQDAVDAASEGDLITVCPGYYDPVVVDDVGVTLQGYGADSTCIIGTTEDAAITIDGSIVPTIPPRFAAEISG